MNHALSSCLIQLAMSVVIVGTASADAPEASLVNSCDIAAITSARELDGALKRRAVEVLNRATTANWKADARLTALVEPSAAISLGAGDVGRPLGRGVSGIRLLAETMHAETYRYLGWDYMDGSAHPCENQKVTVEFANNRSMSTAEIEFAFRNGQVVSAVGWERSFKTGPVAPVSDP